MPGQHPRHAHFLDSGAMHSEIYVPSHSRAMRPRLHHASILCRASEEGQAFRDRHFQGEGFIIPNPWDAGTARLLAHAGFEALATTSAGLAFSLGLPDGAVPRERVLATWRRLPRRPGCLSAPTWRTATPTRRKMARTIRQPRRPVSSAPPSGCHRPPASPFYNRRRRGTDPRGGGGRARPALYPHGTGRELLPRQAGPADTIARLQAFQEAGADVLYAPGLSRSEDIATVIRAVDRPVNVPAGFGGSTLNAPELFALGARRVSVGGAMARSALAPHAGRA